MNRITLIIAVLLGILGVVALIFLVQNEADVQDCTATYDAQCVMDNAKHYGYVLPPGTDVQDIDQIGESACQGIEAGLTKESYIEYLADREYDERTAGKMVDLVLDTYCPTP